MLADGFWDCEKSFEKINPIVSTQNLVSVGTFINTHKKQLWFACMHVTQNWF